MAEEKAASVADAFAQAEEGAGLSKSWDTHMDDSGEIIIRREQPVHSQDVNTNNEQQADSEQKTEQQQAQQQEELVPVKRLKDTQRAFHKANERAIKAEALVESLEKRLERLEGAVAEKSQSGESQPEVDFEEIMSDPNAFKKYIESTIRNVAQESIKPAEVPPDVQEALDDYKIRTDLQNLMVEEGVDNVVSRLPVMKSLLEVYPDASFRQLFEGAQHLESREKTTSSESKEKGTGEQPSAQSAQGEANPKGDQQSADGTADDLRARAAKLRTEQSTPGSLKQQGTKPTSVGEAVDMAIDKLDY